MSSIVWISGKRGLHNACEFFLGKTRISCYLRVGFQAKCGLHDAYRVSGKCGLHFFVT
jgi:hypothetical protein